MKILCVYSFKYKNFFQNRKTLKKTSIRKNQNIYLLLTILEQKIGAKDGTSNQNNFN